MLLLFFNTNQHRPAVFVCGWTCICAYMCAEWEQGHSWGLGFLSEHHLQAFLHLIVKPPLYSISVSASSTLPACFPPFAIACCMLFISHEQHTGRKRQKPTGLLTNKYQLTPAPSSVQMKKKCIWTSKSFLSQTTSSERTHTCWDMCTFSFWQPH